ncbi:hypothetical protein TNCV_2279921 [Trichonephila clavipes]|uniref:Secreted protein n=1 Tax=Trichonephila clavipes TaxID=2585209 RepID=A0A8X6RAG6_TRICX|nr:hypothetical protein TNCV_2279921 [Trichonephila clavipes]
MFNTAVILFLYLISALKMGSFHWAFPVREQSSHKKPGSVLIVSSRLGATARRSSRSTDKRLGTDFAAKLRS